MVQIRREDVRRRSRAFGRSFVGFLRFLLVSALIPMLFLVRFWWTTHHGIPGLAVDNNLRMPPLQVNDNDPADPVSAGTQLDDDSVDVPSRPIISDVARKGDNVKDNQPSASSISSTLFDFLNDFDFTKRIPLGSDVVELYHCNVPKVLSEPLRRSNFTAWAEPLVNDAVAASIKAAARTGVSSKQPTGLTSSEIDRMRKEFVLEILEMYANAQGLCDFEMYQVPSVPITTPNLEAIQTRIRVLELDAVERRDENLARIIFVIVAFRDVDHLERLLHAIHLPQHVITIQLERRTESAFVAAVHNLVQEYENVFVLQFGTVLYKTDSVSMINYRIMQWITLELELEYDFYVTLDGASFPLIDATSLAQTLALSPRRIWLGEMTQKGAVVNDESQSVLLKQKRLIFTAGAPKLHKRLPRRTFDDNSIPQRIRAAMTRKTNSGNQGIYRREIVSLLLESAAVRELFAISKYGCCCCLEERNWVAALTLIGCQTEALEQPSIFQVWGGAMTCGSSMNNAVLSRNESLCYRTEDATRSTGTNRTASTTAEFLGNETWDYLQDAKAQGIFFARKFSSDDPSSVQLLEQIEDQLWSSKAD